jgi:hypothetical protein
MRALTEAEVKLIAGGTGNNSSITVSPGPIGPYWPAPSTWTSGHFPSTSVSHSGGGGGGGGATPPGVDPNHNYDSERDTIAQQLKSDINNLSDHNTNEHGAIIYVGADGGLHHSPIFTGTESGINPQIVKDWMAANGVTMDQLVGFVENHDSAYFGTSGTDANANRYPSANDWNFADSFVNEGAGAGTSGFALYVVDTVGQLRQFDHADEGLYKGLTQGQKDSGTDLPATM